MRTRYSSFIIGLAGLLGALSMVLVGGCDLREVVEVERPFFKEPPAEALGFLGYDDQDEKLTVCGNCHVGQQAEWQFTAHAGAWAGLQESGHAQAFCENCHAVGALGNPVTQASGWAATQDERYHDVQCESCHGPGQAHVANPDIDTAHPMASLAVGDIAADIANATGCAQCHQGAHHPFADEWAQSGHAVVSSAAGREACQGCHQGQGILAAWGVTDNYVEKDSPEHLAITCGVCHDPHNGENEGQLRRPVATVSVEQHLCAACHDRRTVPDPNSSHGLSPHAPQTALLVGDAGWFPPNANFNQGDIIGTHGSDANPKLCATCHVNAYEVTDEDTGDFVFNATGHLFTAIPCVDAQGKPTTNTDCAIATTERSFTGCATSGCHATETAAAAAMASTSTQIQELADDLIALLRIVDPNLAEAGGAIDPADPTFTTAEGAFFNYNLAAFGGDVYGGSAHNPFLIEALLIASMDAVLEEYGNEGPGKSTRDLKQELQDVLDRMPPKGSVRPLVRQ